ERTERLVLLESLGGLPLSGRRHGRYGGRCHVCAARRGRSERRGEVLQTERRRRRDVGREVEGAGDVVVERTVQVAVVHHLFEALTVARVKGRRSGRKLRIEVRAEVVRPIQPGYESVAQPVERAMRERDARGRPVQLLSDLDVVLN